jgi:cytochrome c-type biogenesis protein CcmH/NrfG
MGMLARDSIIQKEQATLQSHPTAQGFLQLGQLLQEAARNSEAKAAYAQSIKLGESSGEAQKALDGLNAAQK